VGLKLYPKLSASLTAKWPQSNQRGIETKAPQARDGQGKIGLNRTSVGLKLPEGGPAIAILLRASIEPAWD